MVMVQGVEVSGETVVLLVCGGISLLSPSCIEREILSEE